MQMGDVESWVQSLQSKAAEFANKTESYVINALVNFRDKRGQLTFQRNKLLANPPKSNAPAALKADYAAALTAANEAKSRADWVGNIADEFTAITGLGVLPALIAGVPVAILLAAIAGVVILITNVSGTVSRYMGAKQISEAATAQGKDPTAALQSYYARTQTTGFFGDAAQLVWPLAIAGAAFLMLSKKR